jgi:uncharacterized membrane protein
MSKKGKRAQIGNTMATFVSTIIIIVILLGYVILSGVVKAASDNSGEGIVVVKGNTVGLSNFNYYLSNGFTNVTQFKFSYAQNKDVANAMKEANYP